MNGAPGNIIAVYVCVWVCVCAPMPRSLSTTTRNLRFISFSDYIAVALDDNDDSRSTPPDANECE